MLSADEVKALKAKPEGELTDDEKTQLAEYEDEQRQLNIDKSRLGKKVAKLADAVDGLSGLGDKIDAILAKMSQTNTVSTAQNTQGMEIFANMSDDDFLTVKDVKSMITTVVTEAVNKTLDDRTNKDYQAKTAYEKGYLGRLKDLGKEEDEEFHKLILDEITQPTSQFNRRYSNDPVADADRNYLKAKVHFLSTASGEKKIPVKGGKPNAALGVGGDSTITHTEDGMPVLDAFAQEFKDKVGMSDESVKKALKGEAAPYLAKKP